MHIIIPSNTFFVESPEKVDAQTTNTLLDTLEESGILLTSYGNVANTAESLETARDYEQRRQDGTCLDVKGVRYVLRRIASLIGKTGGTWNYTWSSRAFRAVFMQEYPLADRSRVGHGEFIAAMLLFGIAAKFTPENGSDCVFKAELTAL